MKHVVLVTSHYLNSHRKAGFHWLADAFWRAGWQVLFFTESISAGCPGFAAIRAANTRSGAKAHRLRTVHRAWPATFGSRRSIRSSCALGLLNRLSTPFFQHYPRFPLGAAAAEIVRADLFVFDSDHGLFLFEALQKAESGRTRFVYRVSDYIPMQGHHPACRPTKSHPGRIRSDQRPFRLFSRSLCASVQRVVALSRPGEKALRSALRKPLSEFRTEHPLCGEALVRCRSHAACVASVSSVVVSRFRSGRRLAGSTI